MGGYIFIQSILLYLIIVFNCVISNSFHHIIVQRFEQLVDTALYKCLLFLLLLPEALSRSAPLLRI